MAEAASVPNLRELCRNACVGCRSKKVRCLQGAVEGTCERCRRTGNVCVQPPPRGPRRPKAPKPQGNIPDDVANRIRKLEQNLEHVTSELVGQRRARESHLDRSPHSSIHSPSTPLAHSTPGHSGHSSNPSAHALVSAGQHGDVISKGLLTQEYAEILFDEFRAMSRTFPYVVLPENNVVPRYRHECPMLLLSILMAASWRDRTLQAKLEREYYTRLGHLMVAEGGQTLELLQSLLIHLGWSHWHMKSTYRLNFFTAAIVANLGMSRRVTRTQGQRAKMRMDLNFANPVPCSKWGPDPEPIEWSAESRRAYIGSYIIARSYSLILRRYDTMNYNDTIEECALSLAKEHAAPSDPALIHYVRLIRYAEDVSETFHYPDLPINPKLPEDRLAFIMKTFETQLNALWTDIPLSLSNDIALGYTHLSFQAYTHEISLHIVKAGHTLTNFQTSQLVKCIQSVKNILDLIQGISDRQVQSLCGYNWARLHYLFHLTMELSLGVESPSWDIAMVRDLLPLEVYIDMFCIKLDECSAQISMGEEAGIAPNWFESVATAWRSLKNTYLAELVKRGVIVPQASPVNVPTTTLPPMNSANGIGAGGIGGTFLDFANVDFMSMPWYGGQGAMSQAPF